MATALITGASSGLGEEFTWQLATAGHDCVVVARRHDRLSELAEMVRSATGSGVEVLPADLSTPDGRDAVAERLSSATAPVSLLVNNAGFGLGQPFTASALEDELAMADVMITATLHFSHVAARAMVERGHGAILTVSSIASHLANSTYAAHKRWQVDFTHALAAQLRGTGVSATVVLPGLVHTEFHDRDGLDHYPEDFPDIAWIEPEAVVTSALAAVRRGAVTVTPTARYATAGALLRLVPPALTRGRATLHRR